MKLRMFALTLVLAVVAWAQQSSQAPNTPSTPAPEVKGCCHHMADQKEGKGCCQHSMTADSKHVMACCAKGNCEKKDGKSGCGGEDPKACMKQGEKGNAQCCKDGKCCAEGKGCCGGATEKTASGCCSGNKCERSPHSSVS